MYKKMYKYRDKVSGRWIDVPVEGDRILELVTRGTLTPYDFVQICEDGEDDTKKEMIRNVWSKEKAQEAKLKGEARREIAEEHWAKLRRIRVNLKKLWEAQLDSLMSKITGTVVESSFDELKRKRNRKLQTKENVQEECLNYWRNAPAETNKLEKEIKNRHYINEDKVYSTDDRSFESLKNWMIRRDLDAQYGCYAFFDKKSETGNCYYIGMTAKLGFKERIKSHFDDPQKTWTEKFDEIHFWKINKRGLTGPDERSEDEEKNRQIRCWRLEKLLIKKFQPKENRTRGNLSDPCDQIVDIIASEISGLCKDGEMLHKQYQIITKERNLSEKDKRIHELEKEINGLREQEFYEIDDEGDKEEKVCISEDQIDEDDKKIDDENK